MTLTDLLSLRVQATPDATALIEGARHTTCREFDRLVRLSAGWLAAQGVRPGDRVGIWMENRIEWLAIFFGLARLGACTVAVNTRFRSEELVYLLSRAKASLLITQSASASIDFTATLADVNLALIPTLQQVALVGEQPPHASSLQGRPVLRFDAFTSATPMAEDHARDEALAILFTTSGTTNGPKLVMHPQRTLAAHAACVARQHGLDQAGARLLAALPLCGVYGMSSLLGAFQGQAPIVLMPGPDAAQACDLVPRHAITHLYGSDELYRRMLDLSTAERPFPSARLFGFAAFRADAAQVAREAWARGLPLTGLYGSSEVHALFAIQSQGLPLEERIRGGGAPAAGDAVHIRIRDPESGAILGPGRLGALEIRSPHRFIGYLDDPAATAEAIDDDGFFRTGDLGSLRPDGSFIYETRSGDAMRLGGYLVNPFDIETLLRSIEGVADAQVVPITLGGQARCAAFVIAGASATLSAGSLIEIARQRMARFKVPSRIWFVEAFPTAASANGNKVQRARLRSMAAERLAAEQSTQPLH